MEDKIISIKLIQDISKKSGALYSAFEIKYLFQGVEYRKIYPFFERDVFVNYLINKHCEVKHD